MTHRSFAPLALLLPLAGCPSDPAPSDDSTTSTSNATTETTAPVETTTETTAPAETTTDEGTTLVADSTSTSTDAQTTTSESSSESTTGEASIADLDMSLVLEDTLESIYTQRLTFDESSCQFVDGCLGGIGERRLLRFSTITPNVGDAAFHVGNPTDNPELFEQSECSGAWLYADYAQYRLLDGKGMEVGTGHKSAFALIDLAPFTEDAGPPHYGFGSDMGISVGWADIYDAGLDCQWVDITDVPAGDYTLELNINSTQTVPEATFENNILLVPVTITDDSDVPGPPKGWVCDEQWYGTGDGCDCGCGVVDADCIDMLAESCEYCVGCAENCDQIDPENNATCVVEQ
jgi:hypothetical protein